MNESCVVRRKFRNLLFNFAFPKGVRMLMNKVTRILVAASFVMMTIGFVAFPAHAGESTAKPLFLSFESDDAYGVEVAKPTTATHLLGSWYGGSPTSISASPPPTHEGSVLKFVKGSGSPTWSGFTVFNSYSAQQRVFTDTAHPIVTLDYYAPVASPVEFKLETLDGKTAAYKAVMAQVGWNALTVDFSTGAKWSGTTAWTRMSIIPDFGDDNGLKAQDVPPSNQLFYLDNISVNGGAIADVATGGPDPEPDPTQTPTPIFMNFEDGDGYGSAVANGTNNVGAFQGGIVSIAPSVDGRSDNALKFIKASTGKNMSGINIANGGSTIRFTSATLKTISFDYHSADTKNSPIQVQLSTDSGSKVTAGAMATPGWNSFTFDMSTKSAWSSKAAYTKLAIFPDYGFDAGYFVSVPSADQEYYLDNISINGGTVNDLGSPPPPPCIGKPSIRVISPDVSGDNVDATYWNGVQEWNDAATMVYMHYFPLRSTISVKYQTYDETCNPYGAGVKVYLAVNAAYSGSQAEFLSFYRGAVQVIPAIPKACAAQVGICGDGQSVLSRTTDDKGQVTFELINTNAVSPEQKPASLNALPPASANLALASALAPSFKAYDAATGSGAGGNNVAANEAIDKVWPHFVNGMGSVTAQSAISATKGTSQTATFTLTDVAGNLIKNRQVTVTTDDGGSLTTPDSSAVTPDDNGFSTVTATSDDNGVVSVTATSSVVGTQTIRVSVPVQVTDTAVTALNGITKITWTEPVIVKVAQTIGSVATSVKVGATITLPAKTSKTLVIKWTTSTPKVCSIIAGKVKGLKVGVCKISGINTGNTTTKAVTKAVTIAVKK